MIWIITSNGGCYLLNAEYNYSFLCQRKYIHARLNPNLIANHKPYPNPKLLDMHEWKVFMGLITEKSAIYFFYAELVYCSGVLHSVNYTNPY